MVPVFFLLAGCMPHIRIAYLQPSEISLPPTVDIIAPVDRVGTTQADAAMVAFTDTLALSPRVKVVDRGAAKQAYASIPSLVGADIGVEAAQTICTKTKASGIAALETLQPRESWSLDKHQETRNEQVTVTDANGNSTTSSVARTADVYRATINVSVATNWHTYDCKGQSVDRVDLLGSDYASGEGPSDGEARAAVPGVPEIAVRAARQTGESYARRIAPFNVEADRRYYKSGDANLKAAAKAVAVNDWGKAQSLWEAAAASTKTKVQGKAYYDLALAAEQSGRLKAAVENAEKANNLLKNKKTANYLAVLQQRQKDKQRLKDQMGE